MITAIHKHVTPLRLHRQHIRDGDLKTTLSIIYDDFRKYGAANGVLTSDDSLKAMQVFCKHMVDSQVYKNILRPQIIDHELFSLMGNTILSILQKASNCATKDNQLTDRDWRAFHVMASLLTSSLPLDQFEDEKVNKIVSKTFFSERFLTAIKECIESLLLTNYQDYQIKCHILSYVFQHVYFHSKAYKGSLRLLLLDTIVRCIVSKFYIDQFDKSEEVSADFLLFDCPSFVLSNSADRHEEIANLLCQPLLKVYKNILSYRGNRKHANSQRNEYLSSYLKLLNHCAMIESTRDMFTQCLPSIIIQLFATAKEYLSLDGETAINSINDEELVATILTLLYNLMPNSAIHAIIKENAPISILRLLCDNGQQQIINNSARKKINIRKNIQFPARSLLALATEDIDQLDQPDEVICLFLTYLTKAIKSDSQMHAGVHASMLLTNVAAIAQNDQVKEQIVEQGALRLLSDCIYDPIVAVDKIQQPALYAIWTISFNEKACFIWKKDEKLLTQLQEICKSNKLEQQKVADGILWRLINEEKFRVGQLNIQHILVLPNGKIQNSTDEDDSVWIKVNNDGGQIVVLREKLTKEQTKMIEAERGRTSNLQMKTSKPCKYDLMISYCHDNDDVCNIIYNCLLRTGKYKIWIDKKEMHGSIMERMAEGVEDSHLMLICMSSAYKNSPACQTECEYAYKTRHRVVFLKVEPNYTPTGWLGLFLGSKYFIDITKKDFLTTFKEIVMQISIQRDETTDYSLIDAIVTNDIQTAVTNALKPKDKTSRIGVEKLISANSNKMLPSDDIRQSTSSSSLSNSNSIENPILISSVSPEKTIIHTASSIPLTMPSTTIGKHFRETNLKQESSISSLSVASSIEEFSSISDSQNKIMEEYFTPEKLAKYYPSNFEYRSITDDDDVSNDFASRIRTSSVSSLSDDEYGTDHQIVSCNPLLDLSSSSQLLSSFLPQMNEDTISLSSISLNTNEIDNPVSEKIAECTASNKTCK